jgi:hypothetical protein
LLNKKSFSLGQWLKIINGHRLILQLPKAAITIETNKMPMQSFKGKTEAEDIQGNIRKLQHYLWES